jgi:hypothetical protein
LPPETATPTLSPWWSMPYLEMVLLVFSTIDSRKQRAQSDSPEYLLV